MVCNVSRLRENFRKMQEVASKKVLTMKPKGKPGKELDPKLVKSIQSLPPCPTVAELKANSTTASVYSSDLISVLNSITKTASCSPAMSKALKLSAATIENLNKAFQDHCSEIKTLKTPQKKSDVAQDVNRRVSVPSVYQNGSKVQHHMVKKLSAFPVKPKADDFAFPQVKEPVRETNIEDTAPKALLDGAFLPAPARTFALRKITGSVKETKVTREEMANFTSLEEAMERTESSLKETVAHKDLRSPSPHIIHRPSLVRSLALPQVSRPVEMAKVYAMPVEERQSLSPVHTRPSSSVNLPRIQTQVKPSLQKSGKPETRRYASAVSGSIEELYMEKNEEDVDKPLHASTKRPSFVIDIKAQENNLQQLDQAFQNNSISSEMYNLCRGTVNQTLKSVELRLGCLLRRYIQHVQMKQLR
ncbi:uncharacterized protein LOC122324139 [Puntigrus tetrazona]|uniref:uncharacterized protein LOC122324139 n=1 Tax=Puntigrus tetrazona TaxID=1606681 RepID=UPI001C8ADFD4|nr:uncharacterized protein LOC122324139 [Puntigrus tetrazona]